MVLTLPMAGLIKKNYPDCKVFFLGRSYTKDVIGLSEFVDEFINYDEIEKLPADKKAEALKKYSAEVIVHVFPKKEIAQLAKSAEIPLRVGTTNRLYHWFNCNKLIKLSRKNSELHEAQLNLKLLSFLGIETDIKLNEVHNYLGCKNITELSLENRALISKEKCNIILHPKSKGSAREWGLNNFQELINLLPKDKYKIFVSGTEQDGKLMQEFLLKNSEVVNLTGKFSLQQFIAFINEADVLVAASTGPLHLAAALGKKAIGLYAPMRPIHPGRWMPIGKDAHYLVINKNCNDCKKSNDCHCIREINAKQIVDLLEQR